MSNMRTTPANLLAVLLGIIVLGMATRVQADDRPGRKPTAQESTLTASQTRGQGLFLQRCSLCHLPRIYKFGSPPVVGPSLQGVFKNANDDQEKTLRQFIQRGTADMPAFRFGLNAQDMDDLVAYLKML
jgi:mono/diheme cytochrome c family protein